MIAVTTLEAAALKAVPPDPWASDHPSSQPTTPCTFQTWNPADCDRMTDPGSAAALLTRKTNRIVGLQT